MLEFWAFHSIPTDSEDLCRSRNEPPALAAFLIFCGLSGAVYLVNDVLDLAADAQHPIKRHRPIASGALSTRVALGAALVLAAVCIAGATAVNGQLTMAAVGYVVLLATYSGVAALGGARGLTAAA